MNKHFLFDNVVKAHLYHKYTSNYYHNVIIMLYHFDIFPLVKSFH
ncbi:unnamed protein product [Brugia timori]|uniref:Uncharacterized protein n=1 Tax=Brugia timori TaxID=42155 RepID=A0A0R3QD66_9BILA|nr:unnamed protein product [Brugia timori]